MPGRIFDLRTARLRLQVAFALLVSLAPAYATAGGAVTHASYLGGKRIDRVLGVTTDASGAIYLVGYTQSPNFPISANAYDSSYDGFFYDAFVTKLSADGQRVIYSTLLGGSDFDRATAVAVDAQGNAYITGVTASSDFPIHQAYQQTFGGKGQGPAGNTGDAFIVKLSPNGQSLIYSTFVGSSGVDWGNAIAVGSDGRACIVGHTTSASLFVTAGAAQQSYGGNRDGFVFCLDKSGAAPLLASYWGGTADDELIGVGLQRDGTLVLAGSTSSDDLANSSALQVQRRGRDAAIARLSADGRSWLSRTYFGGGSLDEARGLAIGPDDAIHIVGYSLSLDLPLKRPSQASYNGGEEGFVAKLSQDASELHWSTYIGGAKKDGAAAVAIDSRGSVFVAGRTTSADFPTKDTLYAHGNGKADPLLSADAFFAIFSAAGSLQRASYLGGSENDEATAVAVDKLGAIHVAGFSSTADFPLTSALYGQLAGLDDGFFARVENDAQPFALAAITPASGGDANSVTIAIRGTSIPVDATARLERSGQAAIDSARAEALDPTLLAATFDLSNQAHGRWDVVVRDSSGQRAVLPTAFTIAPKQPPQIVVDLVARSKVRVGRPTRASIQVTNAGNSDAFGLPVWLRGLPADLAWELPFELQLWPKIRETMPGIDFQRTGVAAVQQDETSFAFYIHALPAGSTVDFPLDLTFPNRGRWTVSAVVDPPFFRSPLGADAADCLQGILGTLGNALGIVFPSDCVQTINNVEYISANLIAQTNPIKMHARSQQIPRADLIQFFIKLAGDLAACAGKQIPAVKLLALAAQIQQAIGTIEQCSALEQGCLLDVCDEISAGALQGGYYRVGGGSSPGGGTNAGSSTRAAATSLLLDIVEAIDPNEIVGPAGAKDAHYISGPRPLTYTIHFENLAQATAAAQTVEISTSPIDTTLFDLTGLRWGTISVGTRQIDAPPTGSAFATELDLRPHTPLVLGISGRIDQTTSRLHWTFSSLDPITRQPTDDPLIGFLPPNKTAPEGQGAVIVTLPLQASIAEGAKPSLSASIVFDANAAIATNLWSNVIDRTAPTSAMAELANTQQTMAFDLDWSGSDQTSGVSAYRVFAAEGDGPFRLWQDNVSYTRSAFLGQPGKRYRFFAQAIDAVELRSPVPASAERTVDVAADARQCTLERLESGADRAVCPGADSGCGCTTSTSPREMGALLLALMLLAMRRRILQREIVAGPQHAPFSVENSDKTLQ